MEKEIALFYSWLKEENNQNTNNSLREEQNDLQKNSGNSGNEVTVDNSSTTKSSQTELSFSKDETFDVNLKHKIEEITNLRVQLSKKDEELNHLKSLQISSETLADRLKLKDKIINECKVRMAENDEKIEKLEGEVVQLNQQNYMLELDKKNYNSKKEAESPALNKLQSEYQHLLKDLSEQRKETKKAEEANKINEEKCKRLNSDIKHQKDCYDDWQKQTLNNHKKELQEEIKKINEQHRDEIKRMTESSLLKQKSDGKSQLQIKEFENKRLNAELETQRKTLEEEIRKSSDNYKKMEAKYRKAVLENQELQQINYNKFEEWKRTELDRHINGFNLEILKIKEEHKNELEMKEKEFKELKKRLKQGLDNEEQINKKYDELLETVGELKKAVFENIEEEKQQPKTSNHQNIQENQEEIRKRLESEYSNKLKNSLRDICEEQHRIKIKKEQLDSMILKQQCTDCELFKFAYNKMKEKNDNCLKSGCEICSGTRSLDSLECQSSFQSSANSSNNQPSPKTPPKHKETSRKRNNQGHLKSNNDSSQSAGQISATRQVFNNSNDIEPGRRTVESGTSSLISIPPLDPQQPEINKSVTVDIKVEMDDAGLDAQLEIQNKNLENNIRLIRSKSVAALYSPPPPPPQTFPITQTNIQSTSRMEDFINPPQPPTYLQTISDNNFRFNQQQFNSVGNSQITTPQIFPQQQTQNQNLQHLGLIYSSEQQQRQLFQQPTIQQQQQIHYPSNISYASSLPLNNPQMIQQNQMSQYQTAQQNRTAPQPIIQNNLNQQNVDFSSNSAMQQLVQQQANFQQQQQVRLPHHQTYNQPQNQNYSTGRPTDPRFQNSAIFNALFSMMQQHSQSQQQPQVNNPQQVQQQPKNKSRRKK
uniref:GRIP domain-containing protein n=1 Tax=Meloidogyne hapla TaxID=6305 RepID=A0A1I8BEV0_MELHA